MCVCVDSQLRDCFVFQLTQGYSHYDRQLRNDLLVIANIVASACPNAPYVETGFVKQLTLFATFQEGRCLLQLFAAAVCCSCLLLWIFWKKSIFE